MSKVVLISWQEIPSMIEAKDRSGRHKIQLSDQFQELIDLIAMKRGLDGSDDYLLHWSRKPLESHSGSPKEAAEAVAAQFEEKFAEVRAAALENC